MTEMKRLVASENKAVGFCGSNDGRSRASACSAQYCGVPSAVTRRSKRLGATNMRLVSSKRPTLMRSSQIVNASPKAARVSSVGQMKSAITVPPASTTRSHIHPMRARVLDAIVVAEAEIA